MSPLTHPSLKAFIYDTVFKFAASKCTDGRADVLASAVVAGPPLFEPNQFPYDLPPGTRHYIMWYTAAPPALTEERINQDVLDAVGQLTAGRAERAGPPPSVQFCWYENPKMTIPEIYHVQVFWTAGYSDL